MKIQRLFDLLDLYEKEYSQKTDAIAKKEDGKWIRYSSLDYINISWKLSLGLMNLGLKKGDKVGTISNNCPEWNFTDMGVAQAGMIHVPIYPTLGPDDLKYVLCHSEIQALFISDKILYEKNKEIINQCPEIKHIITYKEVAGLKNINVLLEEGESQQAVLNDKLTAIKKSIKEDDTLSIIYTSGTTGSPKGVMLSHKNILSNTLTTGGMLPLNHTHRALSFLPLSHVYERMMNYNFQFNGVSIYYAENLGSIANNLKEIKPHVFNTVPRLMEKVYDSIIAKGKDLKGIKKSLFFWAHKVGMKYDFHLEEKFLYKLKLTIARKLVFSKWKEGLGGSVNLIVSGGSTLQTRLQRIFWAAEMPVYEGYGLTETSPVIAVNDPRSKKNVKFGTVGPELDGVTIKIADDGEILCKGPNVMKGYFKDEKMTREIIDEDGWLHTGDIGILIDNKFVKITDRKKEIFKTSSGKYIAPQVIENILKESIYIEQAMVVGENEKFASALISPNFNYLHHYANKHKLHYRDNKELIDNQKIISRIQKEVNKCNDRLGQTEKIKRFRLVFEEWSTASGELSQTLKLKRKELYKKYDPLLRDIYSYDKSEYNRALKD